MYSKKRVICPSCASSAKKNGKFSMERVPNDLAMRHAAYHFLSTTVEIEYNDLAAGMAWLSRRMQMRHKGAHDHIGSTKPL